MTGVTFYFQWEILLMEWIQSRLGSFGTALASICTMFGEELILVAILGFLYWCYDKEFGKFVGTNLAVAIVLNPLVKNIFLRRRPYFDHSGIQCLRPVDPHEDIYNITAQGYSFPSGHSMSASAAYGAIGIYKKNPLIRFLSVLLPLLVGISRFALGVHYPTDVFAGWILGGLIVIGLNYLYRHVSHRPLLYLVLILLGLPGFFYCTSSDYYTGYGLMIGIFSGFLFEEKFVHFENTRKPFRGLLRILGGVSIFFGINTLLKLPFSNELLESGTLLAHLIRTCRYGITAFTVIGVYPLLFAVMAPKRKKL